MMIRRNFKLKFLIMFILVALLSGVFSPLVTCAMSNDYMNPNQFDDASYNKLSDTQVGGISIGGVLKSALGIILTLVRIVAVGWAIIMAVFISFKYMTGSAAIKSQLKTDMPTYVIGAVVLFGSAGIITLIQYFIEDVIK